MHELKRFNSLHDFTYKDVGAKPRLTFIPINTIS